MSPARSQSDGPSELTRVAELEREVEQLDHALTNRAVIDQAKGMLMLRFGLDATTAFVVLARWASDTETKISVIAQHLSDSAALGGEAAAGLMDILRAGIPSTLGDEDVAHAGR